MLNWLDADLLERLNGPEPSQQDWSALEHRMVTRSEAVLAEVLDRSPWYRRRAEKCRRLRRLLVDALQSLRHDTDTRERLRAWLLSLEDLCRSEDVLVLDAYSVDIGGGS